MGMGKKNYPERNEQKIQSKNTTAYTYEIRVMVGLTEIRETMSSDKTTSFDAST
jgi:hypothetical protein